MPGGGNGGQQHTQREEKQRDRDIIFNRLAGYKPRLFCEKG